MHNCWFHLHSDEIRLYWTALLCTVFTMHEISRGGKKSKQMQFITRV